MRFVQFSYYKTINRIAPCGAIHCHLRCSVVMPFCGRFWYSFGGLCGLVNTPSQVFNLWTKFSYKIGCNLNLQPYLIK